MSNENSLRGCIILIVQRIWMAATALATAFEAKGAQAVLVNNSPPDLGNVPNLAAAVLGSHNRDLCRQLRRVASLSSCTQGAEKRIMNGLRQQLLRSQPRQQKSSRASRVC